jgi:hypothetical protein
MQTNREGSREIREDGQVSNNLEIDDDDDD